MILDISIDNRNAKLAYHSSKIVSSDFNADISVLKSSRADKSHAQSSLHPRKTEEQIEAVQDYSPTVSIASTPEELDLNMQPAWARYEAPKPYRKDGLFQGKVPLRNNSVQPIQVETVKTTPWKRSPDKGKIIKGRVLPNINRYPTQIGIELQGAAMIK